jgi:hypothetical protein
MTTTVTRCRPILRDPETFGRRRFFEVTLRGHHAPWVYPNSRRR